MLLQSVIFLVGLGVLYLGAEWLVKGAAGLALRFGVRPMIVGITVVALGTSMPEFVVNSFAAFSGEDSLALGNIVGSNICNVALILGMSALVLPMVVNPSTLKKEYPIMIGVLIVFYLLALDGIISKGDGLLLVAGLVAFIVFIFLDARSVSGAQLKKERLTDDGDEAPDRSMEASKVLYVFGGIIFLAAGARGMVYAAVNVADMLEIDPIVVGLTIVAVGTSLPELAASLVSAARQEVDISLGNVLGSNMLNVLFVVGLVSLIEPLPVDQTSLELHFPVMIFFGVVLLPLAWTQFRITRVEGGFLVAGFIGYMAFLVAPYF